MRIICLTTFLDGKDRYEKDDTRTVDDERGAYFIANGWARVVDGEAAQATVPAGGGDTSLSVHDGVLGIGDSNG